MVINVLLILYLLLLHLKDILKSVHTPANATLVQICQIMRSLCLIDVGVSDVLHVFMKPTEETIITAALVFWSVHSWHIENNYCEQNLLKCSDGLTGLILTGEVIHFVFLSITFKQTYSFENYETLDGGNIWHSKGANSWPGNWFSQETDMSQTVQSFITNIQTAKRTSVKAQIEYTCKNQQRSHKLNSPEN